MRRKGARRMRNRQDLVELRRRPDPSERTRTRPLKLPWRRPSPGSRVDGVGPHRADLDFACATFRVLTQKEEKQFEEYRTRELVMEAWERQ